MPDRLPTPSDLALIPRKPSQRRKERTVICLAMAVISAVGPAMGLSCTVLPVLEDMAGACDKPGTSSRGLWTASELGDGVDDDCLLGSALILCKLPFGEFVKLLMG